MKETVSSYLSSLNDIHKIRAVFARSLTYKQTIGLYLEIYELYSAVGGTMSVVNFSVGVGFIEQKMMSVNHFYTGTNPGPFQNLYKSRNELWNCRSIDEKLIFNGTIGNVLILHMKVTPYDTGSEATFGKFCSLVTKRNAREFKGLVIPAFSVRKGSQEEGSVLAFLRSKGMVYITCKHSGLIRYYAFTGVSASGIQLSNAVLSINIRLRDYHFMIQTDNNKLVSSEPNASKKNKKRTTKNPSDVFKKVYAKAYDPKLKKP